jgi:hypothetical protein
MGDRVGLMAVVKNCHRLKSGLVMQSPPKAVLINLTRQRRFFSLSKMLKTGSQIEIYGGMLFGKIGDRDI